MARRRMTVKRIDPWSVLKFAVIVNLALLAVGLLVAAIVWMIVERLQLVDQVCSILLDVGFTACGVNAGNLFRALILLGLLGVVVQTAVMVFFTFLYNLIADLTGGLTFGVVEEVAKAGRRTVPGQPAAAESRRRDPDRSGLGWAGAETTAGRPPVVPLGREDDTPGAWTDGFAADESPADPRRLGDTDDDLFGSR
ncbi:MAG: DUF3566 domain-containing protein [Actinobacteria bacterium]|nr:DUF3566 domain-containing protein [Actinomycetota bacterium]